jgi:hypothetical protein
VEDGAVEDGAVEEGAAGEDEAVNLEIPAEPSGSTLSSEWGGNWASSSHLKLVSGDTGNRNMEKDTTNLWYSENKAEQRSNSVLPSKRSNRKRGKVRRRKTTTTTRKIRSRKLRTRWKNWQSQCQSSGH